MSASGSSGTTAKTGAIDRASGSWSGRVRHGSRTGERRSCRRSWPTAASTTARFRRKISCRTRGPAGVLARLAEHPSSSRTGPRRTRRPGTRIPRSWPAGRSALQPADGRRATADPRRPDHMVDGGGAGVAGHASGGVVGVPARGRAGGCARLATGARRLRGDRPHPRAPAAVHLRPGCDRQGYVAVGAGGFARQLRAPHRSNRPDGVEEHAASGVARGPGRAPAGDRRRDPAGVEVAHRPGEVARFGRDDPGEEDAPGLRRVQTTGSDSARGESCAIARRGKGYRALAAPAGAAVHAPAGGARSHARRADRQAGGHALDRGRGAAVSRRGAAGRAGVGEAGHGRLRERGGHAE